MWGMHAEGTSVIGFTNLDLRHISFQPFHGPEVDSAPSENEYQEYILGVKAAGARG